MNTKLTLRLDDELIDSAKQHAARTGKSVSRIVADLFEMIRNEKQGRELPLPPVVKSLKGALKGRPVEENEYRKHLEEKYL
ncbi:DUF6364 family protein [Desulfonatronum lacustre]|uniref:DUF6364 family protein n=1 Tax=Desulfonatronum lacustre TaxID=66849 RepID=UPI00048B70B9|nr:DUF6364 family protein [Desulfonatronum lacustre]SMP46385.1 hypothetical protein SAMN06295888_10426 [Desulfonatronum zhilinae]